MKNEYGDLMFEYYFYPKVQDVSKVCYVSTYQSKSKIFRSRHKKGKYKSG